MSLTTNYLKKLTTRGKESHIYRQYQLLGLEVAQILHDERHKSLYIKLAKMHGGEKVLRLAKEVAERRDVRNPGAYFMRVIAAEPKPAAAPIKTTKTLRKIAAANPKHA